MSLSNDDPPVLTALAVGNVTITAGGATADVPIGTILWSNPGNGSGVARIVPAVPSTSGVADVFAFQNDGTVQAITSDGMTAWTAELGASGVNPQNTMPDFQGGLILTSDTQIWKLDGVTDRDILGGRVRLRPGDFATVFHLFLDSLVEDDREGGDSAKTPGDKRDEINLDRRNRS